jgi:glycosyltransferase involved in cell wall biosynthesis
VAKAFAIIIPVYNEGRLISETVGQILRKVRGDFRVYFVHDMEEDTSLPYIRQFNDSRLFLMRNKYGRGALNAIKTGLEGTKEDYAVVFMADLSEDPKYINDMLNKAEEGYDIVCGSRYAKGGDQLGAPKLKSFLSRMAGLSLRILTGIPTSDVSNSFKLYSRKVLDSVEVQSTGGFEIGLEILVKAYLKGYRITEVPVVWKERGQGVSRFNFAKWLPKYLYWYFYLIINKFTWRRK